MTKDQLIEKFALAAEKQKFALNQGGWGHAGWCNFQRPECPRCNCGVNDLQTALTEYKDNYLRRSKLRRISKKINNKI